MWGIAASSTGGATLQHARAGKVYCRGPLLDAVQRARLFDDAKHFVDMPMRHDPEEVLQAFEALPPEARADPARLRAFLAEHFDEPGAELEPFVPAGCPEEPPFVARGGVSDPALREFAVGLHKLWPTLCRVTAPAVAAAPHRNSALPRKYPMVLPGGRFRETYYWDSLWIVHGLLASGMLELAKGLVQNLLGDVDEFGFVPNGGRIYYLNRSQPPLLCAMVAAVACEMDRDAAAGWLQEVVGTLRREYDWWMSPDHGHAVSVGDFTLNRYFAYWNDPRPESYWQDYDTAAGDPHVYRELATVAETGWDFSSRWTRDGGLARGGAEAFRLKDSEATRILPIDLNAILYAAECGLAAIYEVVSTGSALPAAEAAVADGGARSPEAIVLMSAAKRRRAAIDDIFWEASSGRWVDAWLPAGADASKPISLDWVLSGGGGDRAPTLADFAAPLWAGLASPEQASSCMAALKQSGLVGVGGVATTVLRTGEQWDAPNAWPPLQSMLIEGLDRYGGEEGRALAAELAQSWVGTCYAAWRSTGYMHEKYSAAEFGKGGAGGEYEPQVGFGWSNGVVLQLLVKYGGQLAAPGDR